MITGTQSDRIFQLLKFPATTSAQHQREQALLVGFRQIPVQHQDALLKLLASLVAYGARVRAAGGVQ
jgi:hypothetical protein